MSRRRGKVETAEYAAMIRRMIRAHGARVAAGDPEDLAELVQLQDELDAAIGAAARGLRARDFAWSSIAAPLGMTRQAAFQRWGR